MHYLLDPDAPEEHVRRRIAAGDVQSHTVLHLRMYNHLALRKFGILELSKDLRP